VCVGWPVVDTHDKTLRPRPYELLAVGPWRKQAWRYADLAVRTIWDWTAGLRCWTCDYQIELEFGSRQIKHARRIGSRETLSSR
jgi:hypothetical protein